MAAVNNSNEHKENVKSNAGTSTILSRYTKIDKPVGQGAYGVVYKATEIKTGRIVAMKKIKLDIEDEGVPSTALREISLLKELKHPNIVDLIDVEYHQAPVSLYLIFEWLDKDLRRAMEESENRRLTPDVVKSYMFQMVRGLEYCHSHSVMHRDLKPQNILIDANGMLKLADFGLARAFCIPIRTYTHEIVTLWYRAPEILLGQRQYGLGVDMWSVGAIFGEMVNFDPLFPGDCEIDEIFRIFRAFGTPNEESWPGVSELPEFKSVFPQWPRGQIQRLCPTLDPNGLDLLEKLFLYDNSKRISARESLRHPYFHDLPGYRNA